MPRILVVDDSETVRLSLADHLAVILPGVVVAQAATAREGLERFLAEPFDLVFLDGVFDDGTRSADVLRAMLAARPRARVVLVTARPRDHPEVVDALGAGAYAFLVKPLRRQNVRKLLNRAEADKGHIGRL